MYCTRTNVHVYVNMNRKQNRTVHIYIQTSVHVHVHVHVALVSQHGSYTQKALAQEQHWMFIQPSCNLTVPIRPVHHPPLLVEAQDVIADTGRSPALHLVLVSEQLLSGSAPAIVQLSMCENSQQSALACIHIAHHRHPVWRANKQPTLSGDFYWIRAYMYTYIVMSTTKRLLKVLLTTIIIETQSLSNL